MENRASTEEIILQVKMDLHRRKITMTKAAEMLGVTLGAVTNQLSGSRPFGRNSARKYAEAFGYSEQYLITGYGGLYGEAPEQPAHPEPKRNVEITPETAEMYTSMAKSIETLASLLQRYAPSGLSEDIKKGNYIPERWIKK